MAWLGYHMVIDMSQSQQGLGGGAVLTNSHWATLGCTGPFPFADVYSKRLFA